MSPLLVGRSIRALLGPIALSLLGCAATPEESTGQTSEALSGRPFPPSTWAVYTGGLETSGPLCFDVKGGSTVPGAPLDVWTCNGTPAQSFTIWSDGTLTGPGGLCLDVLDGDSYAGVLEMNTCNGAASQKWALCGQRLVGLGNRCLVTPSVVPAPNDVPVLGSCDSGRDIWMPIDQPTTFVGIEGHCLDVLYNGTPDGTPLDAATCNGTSAQSWHLTSSGQIVSGTGKCLDVFAGRPELGKVDIATCNGTAAQNWALQGRAIVSLSAGAST
jgi:hypothetical protein